MAIQWPCWQFEEIGMDEDFGMPPGSEIRGGKSGGRVVFRWPAPANWLERLGPERAFWVATAICGPCAIAAFLLDPIYAVVFLFAILFGAGACGGQWRTSGFEEVSLEDDTIVIRRGKNRGGVIPPLDVPAQRQVARIGYRRLAEPRLEDTRRGRVLVLSDGRSTFPLGAALGRDDLSRLQLFIRERLRM
jgi:hypothetical protein